MPQGVEHLHSTNPDKTLSPSETIFDAARRGAQPPILPIGALHPVKLSLMPQGVEHISMCGWIPPMPGGNYLGCRKALSTEANSLLIRPASLGNYLGCRKALSTYLCAAGCRQCRGEIIFDAARRGALGSSSLPYRRRCGETIFDVARRGALAVGGISVGVGVGGGNYLGCRKALSTTMRVKVEVQGYSETIFDAARRGALNAMALVVAEHTVGNYLGCRKALSTYGDALLNIRMAVKLSLMPQGVEHPPSTDRMGA